MVRYTNFNFFFYNTLIFGRLPIVSLVFGYSKTQYIYVKGCAEGKPSLRSHY